MNALGDGSLFRDLNWADLRNGPDDPEGLDKLYAALTGSPLPDIRGLHVLLLTRSGAMQVDGKVTSTQ
jgi:hypothetical protein